MRSCCGEEGKESEVRESWTKERLFSEKSMMCDDGGAVSLRAGWELQAATRCV